MVFLTELVNKDMPRAIIFANGNLPDVKIARDLLQPDDFLIGVDGGTVHIFNMGLIPNVVIGDLDSTPEPTLSKLTSSDIEINLYPADKNETDLELALSYAIDSGYQEILLLAALGGRLDHALSNISLLADPRLLELNARMDDGVEELFFCRDQVQVRGSSGDIVSLIPWGGAVAGIITENLKWPLRAETLLPYRSRGISNEMLAEQASIKIESGLLLVIHRRIS
jgi:thiamine pyrophosphokinase